MQKIKDFIAVIKNSYRPFMRPASVIFLLLVTGQLVFLSFPYLQGRIIDNLAEKAPLADSMIIGLIMLGFYFLLNLLNYIRERYEFLKIDYELPKFTSKEALEKLFRFSLGQHINENSGLRLTVVNKGTQAMLNMATNFLYSFLPFILQIILTTLILLWFNLLLGIIVTIFSALYLYITFRYNINFYPKMSENRDRWNKQYKHYSEIIRNVKLIKLSAKENEAVLEFQKIYDETSFYSKYLWVNYAGAGYIRGGLINVGQIGALMVGVYLVHIGVESPGKIVMLIGWMSSIFGYIANLGWLQRQMIQHLADINKFNEMLNQPQAVVESKNPITLNKIEGRIEFQNVSFAYPELKTLDDEKDTDENRRSEDENPDNKEILKNVSFGINPGETVAIVGHSGAGKTTIVNLLLRGYDPDYGKILIDGVDLRELEFKSYLRAIGYVPQHVELFDNTLRYNLTFAVKNSSSVTEAEIEEVAKKSRIDQFYDRLGEKRFDTLIGENGIKLSGGERQRVGIARVLLKKPDILIFDEATSSLDAENEALIHDAMREALLGRTGIIIAHRLSTIRDAHKIVVMDAGGVAGIGTHDELIVNCEVYRKLIERQMVV